MTACTAICSCIEFLVRSRVVTTNIGNLPNCFVRELSKLSLIEGVLAEIDCRPLTEAKKYSYIWVTYGRLGANCANFHLEGYMLN